MQSNIIEPEVLTYQINEVIMQYAVTGSKKNKVVLFIHGSPGSWNAFSKYLEDKELQKEAILVSIDRHGYGGSMPGISELSLENHARYTKEILGKYNLPTLVVGHSYGGPVALRMAMDYPERVTNILLLAPSISPELEEVLWYQKVANWKIIRLILPGFIDVANQEILPLKGELEKTTPLWKNLQTPMTLIQGDNDTLVPPGNADYAEKMYPNKSKLKIIRGDMNHFIPWNRYNLIQKEILEILSTID